MCDISGAGVQISFGLLSDKLLDLISSGVIDLSSLRVVWL